MRHGVEVFIDSRDYALRHEIRFVVRSHVREPLVGQVDDAARLDFVPFEEDRECLPTLVLDEAELRALAKALDPWRGKDVTAEAFDDVRVVRDRLLTLVETVVNR